VAVFNASLAVIASEPFLSIGFKKMKHIPQAVTLKNILI